MKRLFSAALAVALAGCLALPALSEGIDLSGLSWDELIALKAQINQELTTRDQWQEVEVPQGLWVVGEDIPEGMWTVKSGSKYTLLLTWGYALEEGKQSINWLQVPSEVASIHSQQRAENGELTEYTFEAKNGMYIEIEYTSAIFTPYTGKPDLGFK